MPHSESSHGHTHSNGKGEYLPVLQELVSLSPLESYLRNLSERLGKDIYELQSQMKRSADNAKHARMSVRRVKQFLSEKMPQIEKNQHAILSGHSNSFGEGNGNHSPPPMESQGSFTREPMTERTMTPKFFHNPDSEGGSDHPQTSATSTKKEMSFSDIQLSDSESDVPSPSDGAITRKTATYSGNMSRSNVSNDIRRVSENPEQVAGSIWKTLETLETKVSDSIEGVSRVSGRCDVHDQKFESTNLRLEACQHDIHMMATLLGLMESNLKTDPPQPTEVAGDGSMISVSPLTTELVESMMASSPLLLAFRQIILKDVADRFAHGLELQAKEIGNRVTAIQDDMLSLVTEEKVLSLITSHGKEEVREIVTEYERRLMEIELTTIKRQEFVTALKTKADAYLITQQTKVGASEMLSVEKRLYERIEELEERVAYYEAERSELREIILSLLKVDNPSLDVSASKLFSGKVFPQFRPRSVVYPADKSMNNESTSARASFVEPSVQPHQLADKPIYRLISSGTQDSTVFATLERGNGTSQSVSERAASGGASHPDASLLSSAPSVEPNSTRSNKSISGKWTSPVRQTKPLEKPDANPVQREMIGLTRNQEAYARFVTQDYNRNVVESLPPIPYDGKKN